MQKNTQKGFTIVETLIVLAIFIVMTVTLGYLYVGYNKSFVYVQATVDVAGSAGSVVSEVSDAVKQATRVVTSHTFSSTNRTTGANVLVVELPSIDSSGNILAGDFDYVAFYMTGVNVYMAIDADSSSSRTSVTKILSDTGQSLGFTYDNGDMSLVTMVNVNIQTSKVVLSQTVSSSLHQQVYLRN
jgi:type II secretory pathway pseudopilin PulG